MIEMKKIPVIAVVGPTASGKSDLAIEICRKFNGEAVCADSMQIYKGMDIATAKVTKEEMNGVKHHLIDFLDTSEQFSVADFQKMAEDVIIKINSEGKMPVVVGGTGLYIDTLLDNIKLTDNSFDDDLRQKLMQRAQTEGAEALLEEVRSFDSEYAQKLHPNNVKRIVRALELWYSSGVTMTQQIELSKQNSPYDVCYIGLDAQNRDFLYDRINRRVDIMLEKGLLEEAEAYLKKANSSTSAQAIGYKELKPYLDGEMPFEQAVENLKQSTRRYAKRQLTWFRKNERINWLHIDNYSDKEALYADAFKIIEKRK
ncbi:MAG: tRNA (adenosine(37)-N6)-dimethylallyltransferase MiaA [Ruminococcus sp.]|nr:tRNA (adenosine(37)-N6)-dimethylallyltransferase MiaA [Candidatus Copronaster equi]